MTSLVVWGPVVTLLYMASPDHTRNLLTMHCYKHARDTGGFCLSWPWNKKITFSKHSPVVSYAVFRQCGNIKNGSPTFSPVAVTSVLIVLQNICCENSFNVTFTRFIWFICCVCFRVFLRFLCFYMLLCFTSLLYSTNFLCVCVCVIRLNSTIIIIITITINNTPFYIAPLQSWVVYMRLMHAFFIHCTVKLQIVSIVPKTIFNVDHLNRLESKCKTPLQCTLRKLVCDRRNCVGSVAAAARRKCPKLVFPVLCRGLTSRTSACFTPHLLQCGLGLANNASSSSSSSFMCTSAANNTIRFGTRS